MVYESSLCPCTLIHLSDCADINECELETHTCDSNANCTDTDGGFNCTCKEGFEGNGFTCTGTYEYTYHTTTIMYTNMHMHKQSMKLLKYTSKVRYLASLAAYVFLNIVLQIFQSVKEGWMIVTQMQTVQTHLEVMTALATPDSLEMDILAQVGNNFVYSIRHT